MRKATVLLAALALFMIPMGALAVPPLVLAEGDEAFGPEVQFALSTACGFEIIVEGTDHFRVTEFSDKDGVPIRVTVHVTKGEATYTSAGGEATEHFAFTIVFDLVEGTATFNGNVFNIHAPGGGILVNDSGQVIFNGELIIHGPHEVLAAEMGDFDAVADLCDALAP